MLTKMVNLGIFILKSRMKIARSSASAKSTIGATISMTKHLKIILTFLGSFLLSFAMAADKDGGRTGVGGGLFQPEKVRTLMKDVWTVFTSAKDRGELDGLPVDSALRVQALMDERSECPLGIEIRKAVYLKTNKADRSTRVASHSEYALSLVSQDPDLKVREVPAYIYRNLESECKEIKIVFSESVWNGLNESQRISLIFTHTVRLAGVNATLAKELNREFFKWLQKNPDIECELVAKVE